MPWFQSAETLSKLIPIAQLLIVSLTIFTIWATVQKGKLEKRDKAKLIQEVQQTKSITTELTEKNKLLEVSLSESNYKLNDLHKKTAPRSLSSHQRAEIIKQMASLKPSRVMVACIMSDDECCRYAEEINNLFKDINWPPGILNKTFLDDVKGDIAVTVTGDELIPTSNQIIKVLNHAGIKTNHESIRKDALPGFLPNTIYLIVGSKK